LVNLKTVVEGLPNSENGAKQLITFDGEEAVHRSRQKPKPRNHSADFPLLGDRHE
jgi:hypothetical protein